MGTLHGDKAMLANILQLNPGLSWRGWWSRYDERTLSPEDLARFREETLAEDGRNGMAQFRSALIFLAAAPKPIKSVNFERSTYGWKHVAERWNEAVREAAGEYNEDYYIGEGAFIAACIARHLKIYRDKYGSTYVNLSQNAARMGGAR